MRSGFVSDHLYLWHIFLWCGVQWAKKIEGQRVSNCLFLWLNSLSVANSMPNPLMDAIVSRIMHSNSFIRNKVPFIIQPHRSKWHPYMLPTSPHLLLFLCLNQSSLTMGSAKADSALNSKLQCYFLQEAFSEFPFLSHCPSYVLGKVYFFHHNIYHAYIYSSPTG